MLIEISNSYHINPCHLRLEKKNISVLAIRIMIQTLSEYLKNGLKKTWFQFMSLNKAYFLSS